MDKKNKNKLDSQSKHLIIGVFAVLVLLTFSAVMLIAAFSFSEASKNPDMSVVDTQQDVSYQVQASTTAPSYTVGDTVTHSTLNNAVTNNNDSDNTEAPHIEKNDSAESTTQKVETISVEGLEEFTKTGDNYISDSPDNEFIELVVAEKGVDAEYLVAIYAVPDLGNNFVLEFDDKRDESGKVIRSPKTLKRIYHINKEKQITTATGKPTGNDGVDYGTSIMTYYLVTEVVMPEYPDYFTEVG